MPKTKTIFKSIERPFKRIKLDISYDSDSKTIEQSPCEPQYTKLTPSIIQKCSNNPKTPQNWIKIYNGILSMRTNPNHIGYNADVDNIGCASLIDKSSNYKTQRFHVLCGLLLSSQTKDIITSECMNNLKNKFNGLTVLSIINNININNNNYKNTKIYKQRINDINICIKKCGFHNKKSIYLLECCIILNKYYNNDIPNNINDLCKLPGIGPKMGYIALQVAWNKNIGIGVDVHVHRICNKRIRFTDGKCKNGENTRKYLQEWMPNELWPGINRMLVGFGQNVCKSKKPLCYKCDIKDICPFDKKNLVDI